MASTTAPIPRLARRSPLPPGPRMPRAMQTLGWLSRPFQFVERARAKYGDTFTMHIARDTFVVLSDPADVKQVFTGDPAIFHAGASNIILLPFLGHKSVLLLDGAQHLSQRRLLLPPFHGEKMRRHVELDDRDRRARGRDVAARRSVRGAPAHAGGDARGDHADRLRRRRGRPAPGRAAHPSAQLPGVDGRPARDAQAADLRARARRAAPHLRPRARSRRRDHRGGDRRPPPSRRPRGARRRAVDAVARAPRGRLADGRRRAARRARHAPGRRSRDDGDRAGLGARAAGAPSGCAGAAHR